jgi:HSP20 family molecular chaperone IbpA
VPLGGGRELREKPGCCPELPVAFGSIRGYGTIRRAFQLPNDASHDKIEASYKDGVLEVTVEKKPEAKSAKIQIN